MSRVALAASITHALVAVGHTVHGLNTFSLPAWTSLPALLRCYAKAGWYQGSVFFGITALYTYQLSQRDPATQWTAIDRAITALTVALYWASSAWYVRHGDRATGMVTAFGGLMAAVTWSQ
ncbi:uncharacterized protein Z520_08229 [Fonsecaea multimorphosa CBS 102226]|uniref:Uncharacterized protein n=1 Tax=Fonsecaea multimorphosa CBS 102226 TaxID=1442371 RepID=A0A0D2JZG7_9EURO|nr:uncharacterized protein Z520_08229 [Fonsecaea multimorphosa CBS 102226]KIX95974.1 hypothetical protein Z520_08229 [Fonsecaea multimorphosa CBS 102226]OAL21744.1 hypothetical protein AYO22_07686 [Fonsecaea multimorphosa]